MRPPPHPHPQTQPQPPSTMCGGMAPPEQSGMQASARPRSVGPRASAWSRYLLQWVDQEPILFVAHISISASNLRSADSSEPSFLFEQTDLCFSLWRFVCHTNWLFLPPAATVFSRERPCLSLTLGQTLSGRNAHIAIEKLLTLFSEDHLVIPSLTSWLWNRLKQVKPIQCTHTQKHNKRLTFWKIVFAPPFCYMRIRQGQRRQIEAKQRDREKER